MCTVACEPWTENDDGPLADYPPQLRAQLTGLERCVDTEAAHQDLLQVADFLVAVGAETIPDDWEARFCSAQEASSFEYVIRTVGIEGTPLMVRQRDANTDGDDLVPHNVVVGGHAAPQFSIAAVDGMAEIMTFEPWTGDCVPFLFDVESEQMLLENARAKKPQDNVYLIATLCRHDQFRFRYFRYDGGWGEIEASQFPKDRALENLWEWQAGGLQFSRDTPQYVQEGMKISSDGWVRERVPVNPESRLFYTGLTARMWAHLESGIDFWQFDEALSDEEARQHAESYSRKYSIR